MTKNNQCKKLIDSSKLFVLCFQTQVGTRFRIRESKLKIKSRSLIRRCHTMQTWNLQAHGTVKHGPGYLTNEGQWCLSFDFVPARAFDFYQKLMQNFEQIILYYHVTKQFLPCLFQLIPCFQYPNMFFKNSCFSL